MIDSGLTHKQQVIAFCIEAIGPLYAGKKNNGRTTTLLAYSERVRVAAARVTSERIEKRAGGIDVKLTVFRDDLVDVLLLDDRLAELAEQLELEE